MAGHKVMVLVQEHISELGQSIIDFFSADVERELEKLPFRLAEANYKVVVFDSVGHDPVDLKRVEHLIKMEQVYDLPVVVLAKVASMKEKLNALEIGCDDFIELSSSSDDACARITKSIYHRVASDQLSSRLELANKTARSAMVDNSDLGANIQFLLRVHDCDNLDQLGQLFFTSIERYGLKCSLQMRSNFDVKNMEAHGMAKDLESQLLYQLKDNDRFIDFGARTVINYESVSLLIKNMPVDEPDKYGAIKDNTFSLVQGLHARIVSLEDRHKILEEQEALKKLSSDVSSVMATIKDSYQQVMRDIANEVDTANELIQTRIPSLALTEADERFIEKTMAVCVHNTAQIFNEGLVVDEVMERLEATIEQSIRALEDEAPGSHSFASSSGGGPDKHVELF